MQQSVLKSIVRLFALVSSIKKEEYNHQIELLLKTFLVEQLGDNIVPRHLKVYEFYCQLYSLKGKGNPDKLIAKYSVKILKLCYLLRNELAEEDKGILIILLFNLIQESAIENMYEFEASFSSVIYLLLGVSVQEFTDLQRYLKKDYSTVLNKKLLLMVNSNEDADDSEIKHIVRKTMDGNIIVSYLESINLCILMYEGGGSLYLNDRPLRNAVPIIFGPASVIHGDHFSQIDYNDIIYLFLEKKNKTDIFLSVEDVGYHYRNSGMGIRNICFQAKSGDFIGILGGSGTGKSTLLNVLNGTVRPDSGRIMINNSYISQKEDSLRGIIGYVRQEDLLIEELTVYQNLYYNTKLIYGNLTEAEIHSKVVSILKEFNLFHIKQHRVGQPLNRNISGGQRKRLNVALELLREPGILLVDEPTSGLAHTEALTTINLLKNLTRHGTIVISTLHQPSSEIFNMLDKLLILDVGGLPIFYGNPTEAVIHFKTTSHVVNPHETKCPACGNVNSALIFEIIEEAEADDTGRKTDIRKVPPEHWHTLYKRRMEKKKPDKYNANDQMPSVNYKIPNKLNQFWIYLKRGILTKVTNKQYIFINLLEAPILALILSYFSRYISGSDADPNLYIFYNNDNIPAYIFMSIIVALFMGIMVSAEEIIRDRKQLVREKHLFLSRRSYLFSKIFYLFIISGLQIFIYVLIGNTILGIRGTSFYYGWVLYSIACFANMLGLNLSAGLKSVVAIYILIPMLIIPQILLSGVVIKFDRINTGKQALVATPVVSDMMATRWAYEALMVKQFKDNEYGKLFFEVEKEISNSSYMAYEEIPALKEVLSGIGNNLAIQQNIDKEQIALARTSINKLLQSGELSNVPGKFHPGLERIDPGSVKGTNDYLNYLSREYEQRHLLATKRKENIISLLGNEKVDSLKEHFDNSKLTEIVLDIYDYRSMVEYKNQYIRVSDPIYRPPLPKNGRAHLFSSVKKIGSHYPHTTRFDVMVIWGMTIMLYVTLYFNVLKRLLSFGFIEEME